MFITFLFLFSANKYCCLAFFEHFRDKIGKNQILFTDKSYGYTYITSQITSITLELFREVV